MNSDDAPGLGRRLLGGGKHSGQRPLTIRRLWALKDLVNKGEPTEDLDIPLAPWRKGTITFALALAGFMVSHCPDLFPRLGHGSLVVSIGRHRSIYHW